MTDKRNYFCEVFTLLYTDFYPWALIHGRRWMLSLKLKQWHCHGRPRDGGPDCRYCYLRRRHCHGRPKDGGQDCRNLLNFRNLSLTVCSQMRKVGRMTVCCRMWKDGWLRACLKSCYPGTDWQKYGTPPKDSDGKRMWKDGWRKACLKPNCPWIDWQKYGTPPKDSDGKRSLTVC